MHSKYVAEHNAKDGDVLDSVSKHGRGCAMNAIIQQLQEEIHRLKAELAEREAALPVHSARPHQIMDIEALEDEISRKEEALNELETERKKASTEGNDS
jgi:uncharacterized small protein (DUF1192 family)